MSVAESVAATYMTIVAFTGTIFNGLVIIVLVRNIYTISVPNVFILSICISGLLACALAIPLAIGSVLSGGWDVTACKAHAFLIYTLGLASIVHLAAIALEKYLTIVKHTGMYGNFLSHKQATMMTIGLWVYSLIISSLPFLGWAEYGPEDGNLTCALKWNQRSAADIAYFVFMFTGVFLLPVAVMSFSYYKIFKVRTKVGVTNSQCMLDLTDQAKTELRKEINIAVKLLLLIFAYLVAWTPYALVVLLIITDAPKSPYMLMTSSLFAKASFLYNPMLYAFISKQFRRKFIAMFCGASINQVEQSY